MLRSLLRLSGAIAFAVLLAPMTSSAAGGPGLAYDEIVRVLVNATPPPPGGFQADLAAAAATPAPVAATPAPRRGINIGSLAGAVLGGGGAGAIAGSVAGAVASNALDNALSAQLGTMFSGLAATLGSFLQPHQLHYAYLNGWERVDDVTAQTATIRKCDIGQVVTLNLARKTYAMYDPAAEPTPSAAPAPRQPRRVSASGEPAAPGTAVAQIALTTASLGAKPIEGQNTAGFASTASFTMSQATGSCHDGGASIQTTEYLTTLARPGVTSCPVRRRQPVPESADDVVATPPSGGCRPTLTTRTSGPPIPAGRLSLYTLVTMAGTGASAAPAPSGTPGGIGFLTERGNVRTLGAADATLFDIPAGFVKSP
jgi:hypothetical protein